MNSIATRADGQPAHVRAKPRLRQSHFDELRQLPARYAEMRVEEARLSELLGEQPQPRPAFLAIVTCGLFGILVLCGGAFGLMTGSFQ